MARVLFVDDDAEMRQVAGKALELGGHTAVGASSGQEAFELLKHGGFDAVISDVMMPDMTGIQLCRLVRQDPDTEHVVFVFLSARDTDEERLEGLDAGADDYVSKPFAFQELWLRLNYLLVQRRAGGHTPAPSPLLQVTLPKLIDLVERFRLTGRVVVTASEGETGMLEFDGGHITEATFKGENGPEALNHLIAAPVLSFAFDSDSVDEQLRLAMGIRRVIAA
jgi:DNA-binding response OmpR family regulator